MTNKGDTHERDIEHYAVCGYCGEESSANWRAILDDSGELVDIECGLCGRSNWYIGED